MLNVEATKIQYNGFNYLVHNVVNENHYGRKRIYHILTNNQKWCGSLLPEIVGYPNVDSKGEHDLNYKRNPSMLTALKPYYTVDFVEDKHTYANYDFDAMGFPVDNDSYYRFIYVEPYDD